MVLMTILSVVIISSLLRVATIYSDSKGKCTLYHDYVSYTETVVKANFIQTLNRLELFNEQNYVGAEIKLRLIIGSMFAPAYYRCKKCNHKKVVQRG